MAEMDPGTEALLKEFLQSQSEQASKGYTIEKLTDAFLKEQQETAEWKRGVDETLTSYQARMNRHARRIGELEKNKRPMRRPEDSVSFDPEELKELRGWNRFWKEKFANVTIYVLLVLLGAGAFALVQQAARAPRSVPQQLEKGPHVD